MSDRTVFVVDDDAGVRDSVCALIDSMGCKSAGFATAEEFLARYVPGSRGVVIADIRMPGMSGLELQEEIRRRGWPLPVIIVTAFARTATTVRAMLAGAVTMIDKPYHDDDLWTAIRDAMVIEENAWNGHQRRAELDSRLCSLTSEEQRVLDLVMEGKANKMVADAMGLAVRTVEKRRRAILDKLGVGSMPEAIRLMIESQRPKATGSVLSPPAHQDVLP